MRNTIDGFALLEKVNRLNGVKQLARLFYGQLYISSCQKAKKNNFLPQAIGQRMSIKKLPSRDTSKPIPQLHLRNANHCVMSSWDAEKAELVLYDSSSLAPTWQLKSKLWHIYGKIYLEGQTFAKQENATDCAFLLLPMQQKSHCLVPILRIHPTVDQDYVSKCSGVSSSKR